jgi:uncharacterized membrane protein YfcA
MDSLLALALQPTTVVVFGVIFVAGVVRSTIGFGDILVSVPFLTFFLSPKMVIPLMAMVGGTNALLLLVRERRQVQWRPVRYLLLASAVGVPLGVMLLTYLPEETINFGLGAVLVAFCTWSLAGRQSIRLERPQWALPFGFAAGVMGGAVTATGPPIVAYSTTQDWDPSRRRATMQGFFLPNGLLILLSHCVAGLWTAEVLQTYVLVMPACFLALPVGGFLAQRLSKSRFEVFTFLVLLGAGVLLLVR